MFISWFCFFKQKTAYVLRISDWSSDVCSSDLFMVSVDRYVNETTRHANVILPPPRSVQSPHFDFALLQFAVRNYARYSPPLVPLGEQIGRASCWERVGQYV